MNLKRQHQPSPLTLVVRKLFRQGRVVFSVATSIFSAEVIARFIVDVTMDETPRYGPQATRRVTRRSEPPHGLKVINGGKLPEVAQEPAQEPVHETATSKVGQDPPRLEDFFE